METDTYVYLECGPFDLAESAIEQVEHTGGPVIGRMFLEILPYIYGYRFSMRGSWGIEEVFTGEKWVRLSEVFDVLIPEKRIREIEREVKQVKKLHPKIFI